MNKPLTPLSILLERLREAGYLKGDALTASRMETPPSLWIQGLQMIGGWLAAIFLLLAISLGLRMALDNGLVRLVLGVLLGVTTAFYLQRAATDAFSRQFALALHLTGQALFVWACANFYSFNSLGTGGLLLGTVAELCLLRFAASRAIAILAGLCAIYLGTMALRMLLVAEMVNISTYASGAFYLFASLLWWSEKYWLSKRYGDALHALAWAFSLVSLTAILFFSMSVSTNVSLLGFRSAAAWQTLQILFCATNVIFAILLSLPWLKNPYYAAALVLSLAVLLLTWRAPALGVGALFLVFGFRRAHGLLSLFGGLLFVFGVSHFYYDLQLTLLIKSGLIVFGGALLLVIRELFLHPGKESHK